MLGCDCSSASERQVKDVRPYIVWEVQSPNPDISGLGVIVGLLAPNIIVCILVFMYYLLAVDPNDEHFCTKLDRSILGWARKRMSPWLLGWNPGKIETRRPVGQCALSTRQCFHQQMRYINV